MKLDNHQLLIIIGAPRSGTTLLRSILSNHPDVSASNEAELTIFNKYINAIDTIWEREKKSIKTREVQQGLPVFWDDKDFFEFVNVFLDGVYEKLFQDNRSTSHILDKHPKYSLYTSLIKKYVPSVKFIHIIRDGRNVAVSMLSASKRLGFGASRIKNACLQWKHLVREARTAESHGKNHYFELRYEDLVQHSPDTTLKELFAFCGLDLNDEVMELIYQNSLNKKHGSPNPDIDSNERIKQNMWENKLTAYEKLTIEKFTGKLLHELNYTQNNNWWSTGSKKDLLTFTRFYLAKAVYMILHAMKKVLKNFI